jgi:hypothetical protein
MSEAMLSECWNEVQTTQTRVMTPEQIRREHMPAVGRYTKDDDDHDDNDNDVNHKLNGSCSGDW